MGRKAMGRKEQATLRRVIALLFALANLAEIACGRSRPVRWLVVLILGSGEAAARDYVARLTGDHASSRRPEMPVDADDRVAEARRLAAVFRALAAALAALPDTVAAAAPAPRASRALAALRDLLETPAVERRDSS